MGKHDRYFTYRRLTGLMLGVIWLAAACISPRSIEKIPRDRRVLFKDISKVEYTIPIHAQYLQGVRICLDPGHGGDAHIPNYKRGPTGVREAEVNWRVANYLKHFLEQSGAQVILTRHGDEDVSLAERADIANRNQVDFFISLHHNAATPETNYTSTWFHAEPDFAHAGLDLARNLHFAVGEIMAVSTALPNGLKSDYLIYPGSGFGVLRQLKVTGCLMESSFHSNPEEEQRLDTPWYNKREAYGYFLGIARYVAGGLPKVTLIAPEPGSRVPDKRPTIELMISDGLREHGGWGSDRNWIFQDDIQLLLDDRPVLDFDYDNASGKLTYTPGFDLRNERHQIQVRYRNLFGNHVLPHDLSFIVAPPAASIEIAATPPVLNDDGYAYARLDIKVLDTGGLPVADDTPLRLMADRGILESANLFTRDGYAATYFGAPAERGDIRVTVQSGETTQQASIPVERGAKSMVYALILDASHQPIDGAELHLNGYKTRTQAGRGILDLSQEQVLGTKSLVVVCPGYFKADARVEVGRGMSNHITAHLYPVMDGVLKDKVFLLDPRYGGTETGPLDSQGRRAADLNLAVARRLQSLLEAAGAKVHLLREDDTAIDVRTRIQRANAIGIGNYLRIDHALYEGDADAFTVLIYPSPAGIQRGRVLIPAIGAYLDLAAGKPVESSDEEIKDTKMVANGVLFRTMDHPRPALNPADPGFVSNEAYALFLAYAKLFGLPQSYQKTLTVRAIDAVTAQPLPNLTVELDRTLLLTTDARGEVRFDGLAARRYQIHVQVTDDQAATADADLSAGEIFKELRLIP